MPRRRGLAKGPGSSAQAEIALSKEQNPPALKTNLGCNSDASLSFTSTGDSVKTLSPTLGKAILAFTVGDQHYGLPVESVLQIIEMVAVTPLPGAPEIVAGIINFHGQVVPLIDMRLRLSQPPQPYTLRTPIIIAQLDDRLAGLVVDAVMDVVELSPQQLRDPEQILSKELAPQPLYLAAVAPLAEGLLPILDPGAILPQREKEALARAMSRKRKGK